MQRYLRQSMLVGIAVFLFICISLAVFLEPSHIAFASSPLMPTATPSPSSGAPGTGGRWTNSTIIAAFINLGDVLLGLAIAVWMTCYQTRRSVMKVN